MLVDALTQTRISIWYSKDAHARFLSLDIGAKDEAGFFVSPSGGGIALSIGTTAAMSRP